MPVPGELARRRRIVSAKTAAPPSGRSSRVTEVTTTCSSANSAIAAATRRGSSSDQAGQPVFTAQNPQARVQMSPRIMTVDVRSLQHSPTFWQRASRQTVLSFSPPRRSFRSPTVSPAGRGTPSHSGCRRAGSAATPPVPGRPRFTKRTSGKQCRDAGFAPAARATADRSRDLREWWTPTCWSVVQYVVSSYR